MIDMTDEQAALLLRDYIRRFAPVWSEGLTYAFDRAVNLLELQHEANVRTDKMLAEKYPHIFTSDDDPTPEEWELIKEDLRIVVETGFFPDRSEQ